MSFLEYVKGRLLKLWWLITGRLDAWPGDPEDGGDAVQTAILLVVVIVALVVGWVYMRSR